MWEIDLEGAGIACRKEISLAPYTTFRIGGKADWFLSPRTKEEAITVYRMCRRMNLPCFILGKGANLLVRDGGIRGAVLHTKPLDGISVEGNTVIAEAGVPLGKLLALCRAKGLSGLEALCGIPATVGGAVAMNAGACGTELSDCVESITFFDGEADELRTLPNRLFSFSYRHSLCHEKNILVLAVTFTFQKGDSLAIERKMKTVAQSRKEKQPLSYPSAGSIFKRPYPLYAPKLIEEAGLKGMQVGDAAVSEKHAGFILNKGQAKAADVERLVKQIKETVLNRFGVALTEEIITWGE